MHSTRPTNASTPTLPADHILPDRARPARLARVRDRPAERIFAPAIVKCMNEGRLPCRHEIEAVAARIWNETRLEPRAIPWGDVRPGSLRHRQVVAAAREALGDGLGKPP